MTNEDMAARRRDSAMSAVVAAIEEGATTRSDIKRALAILDDSYTTAMTSRAIQDAVKNRLIWTNGEYTKARRYYPIAAAPEEYKTRPVLAPKVPKNKIKKRSSKRVPMVSSKKRVLDYIKERVASATFPATKKLLASDISSKFGSRVSRYRVDAYVQAAVSSGLIVRVGKPNEFRFALPSGAEEKSRNAVLPPMDAAAPPVVIPPLMVPKVDGATAKSIGASDFAIRFAFEDGFAEAKGRCVDTLLALSSDPEFRGDLDKVRVLLRCVAAINQVNSA